MNVIPPEHLSPEDAELYVALYRERNGVSRRELTAVQRAANRARARVQWALELRAAATSAAPVDCVDNGPGIVDRRSA